MKTIFVYLLTLILLFALNGAFPTLKYGAAPNFLFLFAILFALKKDNRGFLWIAFFSGLLLDLFSGGFFGAFTLAMLLVCALAAYTAATLFTIDLSIEARSILVAAANLIFVLVLFIINLATFKFNLAPNQISPQIFAGKVWLDLILNLIFAMPIYYLLLLDDKLAVKGSAHR